MAEEGAEKPRKRVIVLSRGSFWWRVIKESFRHSREPFEHVTTYLALVAGAVVTLFLLHLIGQEGVDRMIYWTLAIPFAVWAVWLIWGLIKMPHKVYKTDITAVVSGAEAVNDRKTGFGNFSRLFLITLIVGAFVVVLAVKNRQITQLQQKLAMPKQETAAKPLPITILPNPTNSTPTPTVVTATASSTNTPFQKPFETNTPPPDIEDFDIVLAKKNAEQAAQEKQYEIAAKNVAQNHWHDHLTTFTYALEEFQRMLIKEAKKRGDEIAQTEGYFQCLPSTIDKNAPPETVAVIRFTNQTNVSFEIQIINENAAKAFQIKADCGVFKLYRSGPLLGRVVDIPGSKYNVNESIMTETNHEKVIEGLKTLIAAQIKFASQTNH